MTYTDNNLIADIVWLYGGHDQFQVDDIRKRKVIDELRADDARAIRVVSAYAKTLLEPPYTIEDVAKFLKFLENYLEFSI